MFGDRFACPRELLAVSFGEFDPFGKAVVASLHLFPHEPEVAGHVRAPETVLFSLAALQLVRYALIRLFDEEPEAGAISDESASQSWTRISMNEGPRFDVGAIEAIFTEFRVLRFVPKVGAAYISIDFVPTAYDVAQPLTAQLAVSASALRKLECALRALLERHAREWR